MTERQQRARWRAIREASDYDLSFAATAREVGLTPAGLTTILYRRLGTTVWPLEGERW